MITTEEIVSDTHLKSRDRAHHRSQEATQGSTGVGQEAKQLELWARVLVVVSKDRGGEGMVRNFRWLVGTISSLWRI